MEAEVRAILTTTLTREADLGRRGTPIRDRFSSLELDDLDLPERTEYPRIPDLEP